MKGFDIGHRIAVVYCCTNGGFLARLFGIRHSAPTTLLHTTHAHALLRAGAGGTTKTNPEGEKADIGHDVKTPNSTTTTKHNDTKNMLRTRFLRFTLRLAGRAARAVMDWAC